MAWQVSWSASSVELERVRGTLRGSQRDRGVTLLLVSHNPAIAGAADRVIEMLDGAIVDGGAGSTA